MVTQNKKAKNRLKKSVEKPHIEHPSSHTTPKKMYMPDKQLRVGMLRLPRQSMK